MEPLHILYEDPHLVICCKPVGVLSEDGQAGRCMPQLLREHYRSLGQKNPYIATVHRLDKITGGVMVFSRRREVTGKLTAAVQAHEIVKEYLAVLRGHPAEPAATLTDLLFRDAGHNKSYVVKRPRKGVRELGGPYDVVVANIVADVIKALASTVRPLVREGGIFLCSGIIDDRAEEVAQCLRDNGWTIAETRSSEGWFSYLCR